MYYFRNWTSDAHTVSSKLILSGFSRALYQFLNYYSLLLLVIIQFCIVNYHY